DRGLRLDRLTGGRLDPGLGRRRCLLATLLRCGLRLVHLDLRPLVLAREREERDLVVAALARLPHQRGDRVAHAGALADPRVDLLQVEAQLRRLTARVVEPERVEVLTTARLGAVGHHHAIARLLLPANAPESDRYGHVC